MIVTIDGPAGAGKSHVAKSLAEKLGFRFLDTGAMYRAVAWKALHSDVSWDDAAGLADLARQARIKFDGDRVLLDDHDVTEAIRASDVTSAVHHVADHPAIRARLVELQRDAARQGDFVTEGRDQGTVAFPAAECKFFLTASPRERARRRWEDLQARGESISLDDVLAQQNERDRRDASRPVGQLVRADDAIEVVTDGMTIEQVVRRLYDVVERVRASAT